VQSARVLLQCPSPGYGHSQKQGIQPGFVKALSDISAGATNVNCPQAGVSAILAKTFLVSFPPLPPMRVITSGIFSLSFPASNSTWAVLSVRMSY
jgi:hypothetical protein